MITPKKQLGQHWLEDESVLKNIINYADLSIDEHVLEIGPGLGSLTRLLLDEMVNVTAVELDTDLANNLTKQVKDPNHLLEVINEDVLKLNLDNLPKGYKVVANIPYYLTSNLLRVLSEANNPPELAVLLVQKEVAQRVCAPVGKMSLLSVTTQMYFEPGVGQIVRADLFTPPPKVDSQVLVLRRRKKLLFDKQDPKEVFRVVKAGFSERRKKLRSSISGGLEIEKEEADILLNNAGIDGNLRAQNLSLKDWLVLAKIWHDYNSAIV